jgi:hypothetical protein
MVQNVLRRVARGGAVVAGLTGTGGFLHMMGAFGPVSCWTSRSASSDGTVEITRGCEAGVDYLLGSTGGNAPVLFFWAVVLLGVVTLGSVAAWTGRRRLTWGTAFLGAVVTIIGVMSIGWYFLLPTLSLLVAAVALSVADRRGGDDGQTVVS